MADHITKTIELNAPIERVWQALSDYREFGAWFRVKIETPFMPGEKASGHITNPGYEHLRWEVTVVAMEAPHRFAFTWHPYAIDPAVDYSTEIPTLVEFTLEPSGGGTRLTVVESGFDKVPAHRRAEAMRMNDGGWAAQMDNIRGYVEA